MSYEKLGLKVGIEVHQQLEGKKLFCSCPTTLQEEEPDFMVKRKLRAVAGERGEVDVAALQEQLKGKTFFYEGYKENVCLVELDEEPPHGLNKEALYSCLQICKILKAKVSPVIQVMRKTVVDGSNTSGFQRTALVGREGEMETSLGKVRIENICLEEDACRIVREEKDKMVFKLDRLGIPLIEIGTGPDIKSPEQCKEAAEKLGGFLRALPNCKRGLGTIRQDVNVSIEGGNRVEIKGAQELRLLPLLVELEVKRQVELLRIKEELKKLKTKLSFKVEDLTEIFFKTESKVIKKILEERGKILGIRLNNFKGFLGRELMPDYRLGTELAERAKVRGLKGLFHADELPGYGISEEEVKKVKGKLEARERDGFVIIGGEERKVREVLEEVYGRAEQVLMGVPREVRRANPEGTTSFLRRMPGAARMYPETDGGLVRADLRKVEVPELIEEKVKRFRGWGLSKDLAELVAKSDKAALFGELVGKYKGIKPAFIGETLTATLIALKRDYGLEGEKISEEDFRRVFGYFEEGRIHKDILLDVLIDIAKGKFDIKNYEGLKTEELHKVLGEIVGENKGAPFAALMGKAMEKLRGKAGGKVIAEELKRMVEKGHK